MRVLLKLILDCEPAAVWRALHSPTVMREVALPWLTLESLEPGGFPARWTSGVHRAQVRMLGVLPPMEKLIDVSEPGQVPPGVRILRDSGGPVQGVLSGLGPWEHSMAVSADPAGSERTLYRDQLRFDHHSLSAIALWYPLWLMWQWRGRRLQHLAPTWAYEPLPPEEEAEGPAG